MVLFDMLHKGTVPVAKILLPLVMVGLSVHHIINLKSRLEITGRIKAGFVQHRKQGIGTGQGDCFALP